MDCFLKIINATVYEISCSSFVFLTWRLLSDEIVKYIGMPEIISYIHKIAFIFFLVQRLISQKNGLDAFLHSMKAAVG